MAAAAAIAAWASLAPSPTPPEELWLANTLVTGQSFRWRRTDDSSDAYETYTGVVGQRLVQMRQLPTDVQYRVLARSPSEHAAADAAVLQDYFNLGGTSLAQLSQQWASADARYAHVSPALPGCRMLRQDPVECLFQFICSSNNHISRINGMVERLCSTYGTPLVPSSSSSSGSCGDAVDGTPPGLPQQQQQQQQQQRQGAEGSPGLSFASPGTTAAAVQEWAGQDGQQQQQQQQDTALLPFFYQQEQQQQQQQQQHLQPTGLKAAAGAANQKQQQEQPQQQAGGLGGGQPPSYFAFPTLEQLAAASEEALRADGFGYRAKFIVGSVQQLLAKPEGGRAWLLGLRDRPYAEAHEALCSLPGVGPKVAACICLFSLDKHDAIPVDTHVWALATRYYAPHLAKKALTPKLHAEVQQAFVDRFGRFAGWAHNCLFISELASHRHLLPTGGQRAAAAAAAGGGGAGEAMVGGQQKKQKKRQRQYQQPSGGDGDCFNGNALVAASVAAAAAAAGPADGAGGVAGQQPCTPAAGAAAGAVSGGGGSSSGPSNSRRRRRRPAKLLDEGAGCDSAAQGCDGTDDDA